MTIYSQWLRVKLIISVHVIPQSSCWTWYKMSRTCVYPQGQGRVPSTGHSVNRKKQVEHVCAEKVSNSKTLGADPWGGSGAWAVFTSDLAPHHSRGYLRGVGMGRTGSGFWERMSHSFQLHSLIHKCSGLTFTFMIWMKIQWAHPDWQWEDKNLQILTVWGESGPQEWPSQGQDWGPDIQLGTLYGRERGFHANLGRNHWEPQGNLGAWGHINRCAIQNGGGTSPLLRNGDLAVGPHFQM